MKKFYMGIIFFVILRLIYLLLRLMFIKKVKGGDDETKIALSFFEQKREKIFLMFSLFFEIMG